MKKPPRRALAGLNPRFMAYARLTGFPSPEERLLRDRVVWPGGSNAGFQLWLGRMYRVFKMNTGERPEWGDAWSDRQLAMFDVFLEGPIAETASLEPWHPTFGGNGDGI